MNNGLHLSLQLKKQRNMKSEITTRKQIYQIVFLCQKSGLSRQSFCEQRNLRMVTFADRIITDMLNRIQ